MLETKPTPKLVSVVNPGNPSGTYIPERLLKVFSLSLSLSHAHPHITQDLCVNLCKFKLLSFMYG